MKIPSRHDKPAIAKYWPVMAMVSKHWPKLVLVDPKPLGPETFACRFRDAVRGITEFNQGTDEQLAQVFPWADCFCVSQYGEQVLIGLTTEVNKAKKATQKSAEFGTTISGSVEPTSEEFNPQDERVLAAIVLLLEMNFLQHAILSNTTKTQAEKHLIGLRPLEMVEQNGTLTIF